MPGPRVFLCQPSYGEVTSGAARGFWRATRLDDTRVYRKYNEGSLLAANFNGAWCEALNLARAGRAPEYFAMIHADVEPQDWWLDTLVSELETKALDVLGVAVPIKDHKGITSVALARPDGDTWRPLCRLTLDEVHRLPETFTSADAGHPILLNTGLWVCRFNEIWARHVAFTINDRISVNRDGVYQAQCEPEDWRFSRLLHEIGSRGSPTEWLRPLRIGCTRKVALTHRGPAAFPNDHAWGEPFDSAWIDKSPLPDSVPPGFVLPTGIDGWLRPEEGGALARLAAGKRVLEIGSYCGLSTVCLARTAAHVVAVDPHDGRATPNPKNTLAEMRGNLDRYGVGDRVTTHVGTIASVPDGPDYDRFDLAFIDGAHDYDSVKADIDGASERLAPGGLLAFHDYRRFPGEFDNRWDPGVTQAVDELVASGGKLLSTHATLAVVEPPAFYPQEV